MSVNFPSAARTQQRCSRDANGGGGGDALFQIKCCKWKTGSMRRRHSCALRGHKAVNISKVKRKLRMNIIVSINCVFRAEIGRVKMRPRWDETVSISGLTVQIHTHGHQRRINRAKTSTLLLVLRITALTIVVSAMDPKLLIKMLQVTFTGGPAEMIQRREGKGKLASSQGHRKRWNTGSSAGTQRHRRSGTHAAAEGSILKAFCPGQSMSRVFFCSFQVGAHFVQQRPKRSAVGTACCCPGGFKKFSIFQPSHSDDRPTVKQP